jgi:SAM-dependent methyltransferase
MQVMLNDQQLEYFDYEYVTDESWAGFQNAVAIQFPDVPKLRFLDMGGGAGHFAKRVANAYPAWDIYVMDIAAPLLKEAQKKGLKVINLSILDDTPAEWAGSFDIVSLNWVMHHLVGKNSADTDSNVLRALRNVKRLLSPRGIVSVYEHNVWGYFSHDFPGRLVYELTSSKMLARLMSKLGSNTAGVGVRFRSVRAWQDIFESVGFSLKTTGDYTGTPWPTYKKKLLLMKDVTVCYLSFAIIQ